MKPTGALQAEYLEELISKEREIEKESERKKAATKRSNDIIKKLTGRRDELLDLLEGREHAQPSLPLTTKPPEKNGKKPEVPPLKWDYVGIFLVALTAVGSYKVEPRDRGPGFIVTFATGNGKVKRIGEAPTEEKAKDLAQSNWADAAADAMLKNAGHGALAINKDKKNGKSGDDAIDVTPRKSLPPKRERTEGR